jgi:hypothetical protein
MSTLTNNQSAALAVFHSAIETNSDFEWGDYFYMDDLLDMLTDNGWDRKAAEGTVGSLLDSTDADVQAFDEVENPDKNDSVEMLYVIHHDHNWGE